MFSTPNNINILCVILNDLSQSLRRTPQPVQCPSLDVADKTSLDYIRHSLGSAIKTECSLLSIRQVAPLNSFIHS